MAHRLNSSRKGLTKVLGFSRASRNMAARTSCNVSGEDDHGGGDPQQILRSCDESLLTAVARLEGGMRSLTDPTQTPAARSSSPNTLPTAIEEHRRLFGNQTPSSSRCSRRSSTQLGQGPSKKVIVTTRSDECKVCPVKNTWTILFVCLSRTNDQEVPTTSGKITWLGEKEIVFQKDRKARGRISSLGWRWGIWNS